jgi:hypothetical protein
MILYRLLPGREGRTRSEFPVGEIHFLEQQCLIDVPDRQLSKTLRGFFERRFQVRIDCSTESILAHGWIELQPGNLAHYQEGLRRLFSLGLLAVEQG